MIAVSPNKRSEKLIKVFALLSGILVGCLYASFGRSVAKQWFSSPKDFTTVKPAKQHEEVNETARFLVSDDTTIADNLAKTIKVLCWIHNDKPADNVTDAIKRTWGHRCNGFITIRNKGHKNSSDLFIIPNNHHNSNLESAYRFIYNEYASKYDWFLKTTGHSYIVMENLRYKLFAYDSTKSVGVGLTKNTTNNQMYLSDKAGYALSKGALKKIIKGFDSGVKCKNATNLHNDELRIGICMTEAKINFAKSNDTNNKQLFFDKFLDDYFLPNPNVTLPYPW